MSLLAIVEGFTTGAGLRPVTAALAQGHEVVFVTTDKRRYRHDPAVDTLEEVLVLDHIDTRDVKALEEALTSPVVRDRVAGVLCQSDRALLAAAGLAERLGLPHVPRSALEMCRDKRQFRELATQIGLPSVRSSQVRDKADLGRAVAELGFPLILKPSIGTGSYGVSLVRDMGEAERALTGCLAEAAAEGGVVLAEEFLLGPVVSQECVVIDGSPVTLGITDRELTRPPFCGEISDTFPITIAQTDLTCIEGQTAAVVAKLGLDGTILHVEFALTDKGPRIIEINPRMGGAMVGPMVELATGWDLYGALVRFALGQPVAPPPTCPVARHVSEVSVFAEAEGVVDHVVGQDLALRVPGIKGVILFVDPGSTVRPASDQRSEIGVVWAEGVSTAEAAARARTAAAQLRVKYRSA